MLPSPSRTLRFTSAAAATASAQVVTDAALSPASTAARAVAVARLPETLRGYGPVKQRSVAAYRARRGQLLAEFGA